MTSQNKSVTVIGAGPGGYAAAFYAADLGMDVTLIDKEINPGGVCLYRGCIPSKALLHAAKVINESKEAKNWGIEFGEPKINVNRLREWKNEVVNQLTGGLGIVSKQRKVKYIQGTAAFINANTLEIKKTDGSTENHQFENAIIATGSVIATIPALNIESKRLLNSTSALDLPEIPGSLLVIGGGYIGLELGSVYSSLGTKVSVVEMMPGLLPGADRDLVSHLSKKLDKEFERIILKAKVVQMKEAGKKIKVKIETENGTEEQEYDYVLMSIGRKPYTKGLGLENAHVNVNERGWIIADKQMKTSAENIYAIGDIVGRTYACP